MVLGKEGAFDVGGAFPAGSYPDLPGSRQTQPTIGNVRPSR